MSKSFYEKINLVLFVQYELEHVMSKNHRTLTYFNLKPLLFRVVSSVIQYNMLVHPIVL